MFADFLRAGLLGALALAATVRAAPAPAVDIEFRLDAAHRLTVRYRAPASESMLPFADHDPRVDRVFRTPLMQPANGCGTLVPGGIALRHDPGCADGALFVVQPQTLHLDAFYEPAQPTTDGGVLFYLRYYAAALPGVDLHWNFVPEDGDYVVERATRHDAPTARTVRMSTVFAGPGGPGTPEQRRDEQDESVLTQLDALQYVYIGHSPSESADGLLWVRDPALPPAIVAPVVDAVKLAWQGYASAAQVSPPGAALVMLAAPARGAHAGFHGDRSDGRMLRLSFEAPYAPPTEADLEQWRHFAAHEVAHLWNHGVFKSDPQRPWLHEGDSEWASLNLLHDAHLLSDATFAASLESAVNTCLLARGDQVAASMPPGRAGDDPYACGIALQLLGWLELRRRDPAALDTPLALWGALHREFPDLGPYRFALFFDRDKSSLMRELLLDEKTAFAATYAKDLATLMLFQSPAGEPAGAMLRQGFASQLAARLMRADCGRLGFTPTEDGIALDADLKCKALPAGGFIAAIAGEPIAAHPRAAWAGAVRQCADGGRIKVGLRDGATVAVACPANLPAAPGWIKLPADVLHRIGLMARPVQAAAAPPAH
jgi:hypothetical protein